jgi:predicted dienelactone hydrolase
VLRFSLDDAVLLETVHLAYRAPAGSGPRHLLFHPAQSIGLLVSELASTLSLLEVTGDGLALRAQCSTLPTGFAGDSLGGHLALNVAGDRVYVSNREHDSIAVFALDAANRALELTSISPSAAPRRASPAAGGPSTADRRQRRRRHRRRVRDPGRRPAGCYGSQRGSARSRFPSVGSNPALTF